MKILHTSDWHLGKHLHERSLLEDQTFVLDQITEMVKEKGHDVLIISGDIYDRNVASEDAVACFNSFLVTFKEVNPETRIVLIAGNHDSAKRLSYCADILPLGGIYIGWNPEQVDKPVTLKIRNEFTNIYLMPFLDPHAYAVHKEGEDAPEKSHEAAVAEALRRINKNKDPEQTNILVAHLYTRGSEAGGSERNFIGSATLVDPDLLQGFDYVALGHLHRFQQVVENVWYPGSPMPYSFSETGYAKGALDVTIENKTTQVEQLPLNPKISFKRLKDKFSDFLDENQFKDHLEAYLEIELTDKLPVLNAMAILRGRFKNLLNIRQEAQVSTTNTNMPNIDNSDLDEEDCFKQFWKFITDEQPDEKLLALFNKTADGVRR
ncbi:MAG: exonuclease SbcCD subunit D [Fibrobacteria bacterium]|nr:exonuclease SbcCD subunit D [Fibrobacteria bacterium]